jgi:hypothetical protein
MGSIGHRAFTILHLDEIQVAGLAKFTCRKTKLQDFQNALAENQSCRIFRIHLQKIHIRVFQHLTTGKGKER